jgi:hypothetical protein
MGGLSASCEKKTKQYNQLNTQIDKKQTSRGMI